MISFLLEQLDKHHRVDDKHADNGHTIENKIGSEHVRERVGEIARLGGEIVGAGDDASRDGPERVRAQPLSGNCGPFGRAHFLGGAHGSHDLHVSMSGDDEKRVGADARHGKVVDHPDETRYLAEWPVAERGEESHRRDGHKAAGEVGYGAE